MENIKDFIFGTRPVLEALESGKPIDKILLKKGLSSEIVNEISTHAKQQGVPIQSVPQEKLNRITTKNHQGVIALLSIVEFHPIEEVVHQLFYEGKNPLIVALDQVTDVRNLGSIIRSAECSGAHAILVPSKNSARLGGDAVKTSAGAIFHLPICRTHSLHISLKNLKNSGLQIVCATEKASQFYYTVDFTKPTVLVMGAEDTGISPDILRFADFMAKIPVLGKISSLNVANAATVLLYEAVRQRETL